MRTVVVRAEVGNSERPYALLQSLVESLLELPGAAACAPDSLLWLRKLLRQHPEVEPLAGMPVESLGTRLPSALQDLVREVAHETRVCIHVDDLHNADSRSLECLRYLAVGSASTKIAWIVTSRRSIGGESAIAALETAAGVLHVSGLSTPEAVTLIRMTAEAHQLPMSDNAIASVAHAAGGNPLFARELSVARATQPGRVAVPEGLQRLIEDRLSRFPEAHLRLLRIVALLGSESSVSLLRRVAGIEGSEFTHGVEALELEGVVSKSEVGRLVLHECWQRAVLETLIGATRAALALECATALVDQTDQVTPSRKWRAADLFREAGESSSAIRLYVSAADELLFSGLSHSAVEVLRQAQALANSPQLRSLLISRLARALMAAGDPEGCAEITASLEQRSVMSRREERQELGRTLAARAEALWKLQRPNARELTNLALFAADALLPFEMRQRLCATGIRLAAGALDGERQEQFFSISKSIADSHGPSTAGHFVALVFHAEHGPLSDLTRAIESAMIADADDLPTSERCLLLRTLARALRLARRVDESISLCTRSFDLALTGSLPDDAFIAAEFLVFAFLDEERLDEAETWIRRGLALDARPGYAQRATALEHALDRLDYQKENFADVLARRLPDLDSHLASPVVTSRTVELSLLAATMARANETRRLSEVLKVAREGCQQMLGYQLGDFPVEMLAETLAQLGEAGGANILLREHLLRRPAAMRHLLAPYCYALRAELGRLDAELDAELASPADNRKLSRLDH